MSDRMTFDAMPMELWHHTFKFFEDVELQPFQKASPLLARLSYDKTLWKHIIVSKNAYRLSKQLEPNLRPSRPDLLRQNIFYPNGALSEASMISHLNQGRYMSGEFEVLEYETGRLIQSTLRRRRLTRRLASRPSMDHLRTLRVFPTESKHFKHSNECSPLMSRQLVLKKAITRHTLKQSLSHRQSLASLQHQGILNVTSNTYEDVHFQRLKTSLNREFTGVQLAKALNERPGMESTRLDKVVPFADRASMVCPSVQSKIHFFEHLHV